MVSPGARGGGGGASHSAAQAGTRRTLSLCPNFNREAVDSVIRSASGVSDFRHSPGIIDAEIVEEAGRILMRKACEKHGPFEDVLSTQLEAALDND